jgi:chaperone required for assembly of F1-ATPase
MKGEPIAAPRRFYKTVMVEAVEGAYGVLLDGRKLRTPAKAVFSVPTERLAHLCAQEWAAQGEFILAHAMPLTRLVNVAIDRAPETRAGLVESIAGYAATDLICFRAPSPQRLREAQAEAWDPLVAWAGAALGLRLVAGDGLEVHPDNASAVSGLRALAQGLDDFHLTGLAHAVGVTGSGVVGFALLRGFLDGDAAYGAATVDERFQVAQWGEDDEARKRLEATAQDIKALDLFFRALGPQASVSP